METYNEHAKRSLEKWKAKMQQNPSVFEQTTKSFQKKINGVLPEKYHEMMTSAIKNMTKAVLMGSKFTAEKPYEHLPLAERDFYLSEKTKKYKRAAVIEGAGTGAGGFLIGLADFPLLLTIKIKFLYDVAAVYGFDTRDYKERLYILYIFQMAFSSQAKTKQVFEQIAYWNSYVKTLPADINAFDWRSFQQEYRDYIDLAKLLQLMPGIGAVVGAYVNSSLMNKLSMTTMYAYHMRWFENEVVL